MENSRKIHFFHSGGNLSLSVRINYEIAGVMQWGKNSVGFHSAFTEQGDFIFPFDASFFSEQEYGHFFVEIKPDFFYR